MSGLGGLLGGLLGLTLLDAGLQAATSNKWLGELPVDLAKGLDYWLSRDQPLLSRPCDPSSSSGPSVGDIVGGLTGTGDGTGGILGKLGGVSSVNGGNIDDILRGLGIDPSTLPQTGAAAKHAVSKNATSNAGNPATVPSGITLA